MLSRDRRLARPLCYCGGGAQIDYNLPVGDEHVNHAPSDQIADMISVRDVAPLVAIHALQFIAPGRIDGPQPHLVLPVLQHLEL